MLEPQPSLREAASASPSRAGCCFPAMISPDDLGPIREAVLASVEHCGRRQVASGACSVPDGTAHHSVGQYPALDAFLERRWLHGHIDEYFAGAPYILHAVQSRRWSRRRARATCTTSTATCAPTPASSGCC